MVTNVGTQADFATALQELVELDYDAIEAYEAAIEKLENPEYKMMMQEFKDDHRRHVQEIGEILTAHGKTVPKSADAKKWLTKGKVMIAALMSDISILSAMQSNEVDTNTAYENVNSHEGKWIDIEDILKRGWEDEKRHKAWLDSIVK
jgi:hypothetical protein